MEGERWRGREAREMGDGWMDGWKESGGRVDKEKQGVMACDDGARLFFNSRLHYTPLSLSRTPRHRRRHAAKIESGSAKRGQNREPTLV